MRAPTLDSTSTPGGAPRHHTEEELVRNVLPAISRLPATLAMRNEANALTAFLVGIRRVLAPYPALLRAVEVEYRRVPEMCRYGLGVGSSDIVCVSNGAFVGLELKAPGGVVSPAQTRWREAVERAGGRCVVVRSVEEAVRAVDRG